MSMRARRFLPLASLAALLLPLAPAPSAASAGPSAAPDLEVRAFTVEPLAYPPWTFLVTVETCNVGTAPVAAGEALMRFQVRAMPGPLRAGGSGDWSGFGQLVHEHPLAPGACRDTRTVRNALGLVGEYEFMVHADLASDADLSSNVARSQAASPPALLGSGLGGTETYGHDPGS